VVLGTTLQDVDKTVIGGISEDDGGVGQSQWRKSVHDTARRRTLEDS